MSTTRLIVSDLQTAAWTYWRTTRTDKKRNLYKVALRRKKNNPKQYIIVMFTVWLFVIPQVGIYNCEISFLQFCGYKSCLLVKLCNNLLWTAYETERHWSLNPSFRSSCVIIAYVKFLPKHFLAVCWLFVRNFCGRMVYHYFLKW